MTRILGHCTTCGRDVFLVNDRYNNVPTRLRAHYPKPYKYYEKHNKPLPRDYCPNRTPEKNT